MCGGQKVQTSNYKIIMGCNASMVTIVNKTVLHIWKLLRE